MSQMPPPPPGQPAPGGTGAVGSNKNLYTILAWALLPPIGSLIFLFVGKDDVDVKYNAANATVIHGAALLIYIITIILGVGLADRVSGPFLLALLWYVVWFVIWVIGLILALQSGGRRFAFPGLQGIASKYVPMVEGWAK